MRLDRNHTDYMWHYALFIHYTPEYPVVEINFTEKFGFRVDHLVSRVPSNQSRALEPNWSDPHTAYNPLSAI